MWWIAISDNHVSFIFIFYELLLKLGYTMQSGVIAKYLSSFPTNAQPTPEEVKNWLLNK